MRAADILSRYGGEEFVVMMPETDLDTAQQSAERLLAGVRAWRVVVDSREIGFTISIGIAVLDHARDSSIEALIERADQAMYAAKQARRDRVVSHT
ncbi:MAG: GGDEF domain-containing protein [Chloroflexota bacterium]